LWKATLGTKITQETVDYIYFHPEFGFNHFGELTSDEESRNNTFGEEFSSEGYCGSDLETVLPKSPNVQNQFDLNMADQNEQIQNDNDMIDNSVNMDIIPQSPHGPQLIQPMIQLAVQNGIDGHPLLDPLSTSVFVSNQQKIRLDFNVPQISERVSKFVTQVQNRDFKSSIESLIDIGSWDLIFIAYRTRFHDNSTQSLARLEEISALERYIDRVRTYATNNRYVQRPSLTLHCLHS
jgi:hypothetical protein